MLSSTLSPHAPRSSSVRLEPTRTKKPKESLRFRIPSNSVRDGKIALALSGVKRSSDEGILTPLAFDSISATSVASLESCGPEIDSGLTRVLETDGLDLVLIPVLNGLGLVRVLGLRGLENIHRVT